MIFGVAAPASVDQPAFSRMFRKDSSPLAPAACASSAKSGASCVQATSTSGSRSASWNAPTSLRHSSLWMVTGTFDFSAAASAFASSGIVRLQLQSLMVLSWSATRQAFWSGTSVT